MPTSFLVLIISYVIVIKSKFSALNLYVDFACYTISIDVIGQFFHRPVIFILIMCQLIVSAYRYIATATLAIIAALSIISVNS